METLATATLTESEKAAAVAGGVAGATIGLVVVCTLIFYILTVIATWKIFKKANEPGWKCLIPIYNIYIMFKIVGMKGWFWGILAVTFFGSLIVSLDGSSYLLTETDPDMSSFDASKHIPTVITMLVMTIVCLWGEILYAWRTSKAFGHGVGYFIGLLFLAPIFWLILGFDKSKYNKKVALAKK